MKVDITKIPFGQYCYTLEEVPNESRPKRIKCPYWSTRQDKPYQENGYCSYLDQGDWEGFGLLWDLVKECSINLGIDELEHE